MSTAKLIPASLFDSNQSFIGTKGLVFVGNKVLVYRRDKIAPQYPLKLDVPGGGRENNESPFENFKRELKEEFGLELDKSNLVYGRRYVAVDGRAGYYLVAKLDQAAETQICFGDEGQEYLLMTLVDFLDRDDAWPAYQERAQDYLDAISLKDSEK